MRLAGDFRPPGDKSISHRIALLALLAQGVCQVRGYSSSADCASTLAAVKTLGAGVRETPQGLTLQGAGGRLTAAARLDCGNSGTTMRFLMGILAGVEGSYELDGDDSLRGRPMERVAAPLRAMGARVSCVNGRPPVTVRGGGLQGAHHNLPVASAQLKSALLLAGMQAEGITTVREPHPSRDHTERLLAQTGAQIAQEDGAWLISRSLPRLPANYVVPADPSSAAFFLVGAALLPGSQVSAREVLLNPTRTGFLRVLERMGARLRVTPQNEEGEPWGVVQAQFSPGLAACRVTGEEIPSLVDEVPILALAATQAQGASVFENIGELRIKETDRIAAVISQLGAMGAKLHEDGDNLVVEGSTPLHLPGELESFGDHRIAMTLAVAGLLAGGRASVRQADCVAISYPTFTQGLERLLA